MNTKYERLAPAILLTLFISSCSPPPPSASSLGTMPTAGSEVVVAALTNRPSVVHVGDRVAFDYALKNTGTNLAPSRSYSYDLYVDGQDVAFDHATADLLPGLTTSYNMPKDRFHWQPTNAGLHHFVLVQGDRTNTIRGDLNVLP